MYTSVRIQMYIICWFRGYLESFSFVALANSRDRIMLKGQPIASP